MMNTTLVEMLENNRTVDRAITYIESDHAERRVTYGELHTRALGILYHLQALGANRGDKLIIFLNNNEQFIDGFWAAVCGGIVPVPLAVVMLSVCGAITFTGPEGSVVSAFWAWPASDASNTALTAAILRKVCIDLLV